MAHSKSAQKNIRQNAKQRLHNRSIKSTLRSSIKKYETAVQAGKTDEAKTLYQDVQKKIDKTAAKNVIRKGTADRMKSRLMAKLAKAKPAAKA